MINTRAMPTTQTAITGVSPPIPAGQEIRTRQCRGPGVLVALAASPLIGGFARWAMDASVRGRCAAPIAG